MNKILYTLIIGILSVSLAGCVTVKKVVRERVDQEISGNQGYMLGRGPVSREEGAKTREYIDVRVELPTWEEVRQGLPKGGAQERKGRRPTVDKEITGNLGYITRSRGFEEELPPAYKPEPEVAKIVKPALPKYEEEEINIEEGIAAAPRTYKVKEGDTLSQIAKDFYGKATKWTVIYEANSDKVKDPNKIKAGTALVIPELKEAEKEYIK